MFDILTLNSISNKIYDVLDKTYSVSAEAESPDGILVRSFNMADYEIKDNLLAVARAGAGVNNIPLPKMTDAGVVVFNTPGANANAVKELVLCGLLLASRDILGGIGFASSLAGNGDQVPKMVEKGKSKFAGQEIFGKTLSVIGLGAIGYKVALSAKALGMDVVGYDPFLPEARATELKAAGVKIADLDDAIAAGDYITVHVPLLDSTRNLICKENIAKMKDGVIVLNMARAELANVDDVKAAITEGKVLRYVVDFPTEDALNFPGIIAIPHLGASTEEAEDNCAVMAAEELKDYLENGNITNSVNFPALTKERTGKYRISVIYNADCGIPEAINAITAGKATVASKERGTIGYALIDTDDASLADITSDTSISAKLGEGTDVLAIRIL